MSTENIFIGGKVPELVRAENGTVLFDKNNLQEGDSIVVVGTPNEADVITNKSAMGALIKRFFVKNGEMVEDKVVEALDDDGHQICDCWESELDGFDLNTQNSCVACVKYNSQDCKEPLARILKDLNVSCGKFLSRKDNEAALDEAYEDIAAQYISYEIGKIKVAISTFIVSALKKNHKEVNDALDLAVQSLNLALQSLR
jgi:hypothetical protein